MQRYFFDFDNGKTNYVDTIGTEMADPATIQSEAIRFLASVFNDAAHGDGIPSYLVSVRDQAGRIIFTTTLTLQSNWRDAEDRAGAATVKRPVVLIVEDEFLTRMNAAEMISEGGFDVVEAEDADEAIAVLQARPDIQVVFTEIRLPGAMDGLQFVRYVSGKWPPIRVIATSGYLLADEVDLPDGGLFLPKPYSADRVIDVIRECTGLS